MITKLNSFAI